MSNDLNFSRRSLVKRIALLAGTASIPGLIASVPAHAQAKVSQANAKYQSTPNGDKKCSNCLQFVPGKSANENGTCKIVEGTISPNGYCVLWVAKQ